ncbi:hypothetical protein [Streptomyces sp. NPDC002853]
MVCRTLDNPAVARFWKQNRPSSLRPWRRDRGYLDSYRSGSRDVVEQLCQQQLYLDRRATYRLAP